MEVYWSLGKTTLSDWYPFAAVKKNGGVCNIPLKQAHEGNLILKPCIPRYASCSQQCVFFSRQSHGFVSLLYLVLFCTVHCLLCKWGGGGGVGEGSCSGLVWAQNTCVCVIHSLVNSVLKPLTTSGCTSYVCIPRLLHYIVTSDMFEI